MAAENLADDALRTSPPTHLKISIGETFTLLILMGILSYLLTARGLFLGIRSEDSHAHIAKLRSVCKNFVGRPDLDMNVIGLTVFPLLLTGEAAIWFTELPHNSICTWIS